MRQKNKQTCPAFFNFPLIHLWKLDSKSIEWFSSSLLQTGYIFACIHTHTRAHTSLKFQECLPLNLCLCSYQQVIDTLLSVHVNQAITWWDFLVGKMLQMLCSDKAKVFPQISYCSIAKSCPTLCNPMDCSMPGFSVHHQLLELAQTHVHRDGDAIPPSHPLSPRSPLALNFSQNQGPFQWIGSLHQVAKVLELQLQHQSFQWILSTDFL